jgi:hypothetical protein
MMVMHETQVIRQLASVCALEGTVSSQASVATVRARLSAAGFPVAECAIFEVLLEFVTLQGAYTYHRYVDDLVDFHQLLVNPRVRRLRDCHFRHVCSIKSPSIKNCVLKATYACPPQLVKHGSIDYFGASQMQKVDARVDGMLTEAQAVYERFHFNTLTRVSGSTCAMVSNSFISSM